MYNKNAILDRSRFVKLVVFVAFVFIVEKVLADLALQQGHVELWGAIRDVFGVPSRLQFPLRAEGGFLTYKSQV